MYAKKTIPVITLVTILCISFVNASYVEGETLLELTITTNDSASRIEAAYFIANSWEEIGVNVTVDIVDWVTYAGAFLAKPPTYQTGVIAFSSGTLDSDKSDIYHSTGGVNIFGPWVDSYNDELLEELLETPMPEDRKVLLDEWQEHLMDELPCIPLYSSTSVRARRAAIENYYPQQDTFYPSITSTDGTTSLVIPKEHDFLNFNPLNFTYSSQADNVIPSLDGLYTYDFDCNIVPQLAAGDPIVSSDGLTWTIVLRDDVYWHDGEQFNAEDVFFSVMAYSDPSNPSLYGLSGQTGSKVDYSWDGIFDVGLGFEGNVSIIDPFIVRFKLPEIHSSFLSSDLMTYILPEHLLNVSDSDFDGLICDEPAWVAYENGDHFIGTAGYYFSSDNWVVGSQYEYRLRTDPANPYWSGTPETDANNIPFDISWTTDVYEIEQIINRVIPSWNDQIVEFEAGNLDFVTLRYNHTELIPSYETNPSYEVTYKIGYNVQMVNFNLEDPVFSDDPVKGKILRKALAHALDKEGLIGVATNGTGIVCDNPVSRASLYYYNWDNPFYYEYNTTLATELLYTYLDYVVSEFGAFTYSFLIFGIMSSGCLVLLSRKK